MGLAMSRSVIYDRYFNGLADGINYQGDGIFKFGKSLIPFNPVNGTILTNNNFFRWRCGNPAPDPWGSIYSNYYSNYVDLTLDINSAQFYDGRQELYLMVKSQGWPQTTIGQPLNSIVIITDNTDKTLIISSKNVTRKSVAFDMAFPWTIRAVYDDNDFLSVYLNGSLFTTYQFLAAEAISGEGSWGLLNYGNWDIDISHMRLLGDSKSITVF